MASEEQLVQFVGIDRQFRRPMEALSAARSASIMRASAIGCCWVSRATSTGRARPAVPAAPASRSRAGTGATCQTRIDWLSTFRLRAGYTWSHFLFYATAGGAVGDFRLSTNPTAATHNPTAPLGWAAAPASNTSSTTRSASSSNICTSIWARLAVRRVRSAVPTIALTRSGSVSFTENLIRAGVNYKFSW